MNRRSWMRMLTLLCAALSLTFVIAACGDDEEEGGGGQATTPAESGGGKEIASNPDNGATSITVGSKNFTEQKLLGEIYAAGLEAAGYKVKRELNLGDENIALKALKGGQIDAYPEYTGTALGSFFDVKAADVPKDPAEASTQAREGFAKEGLTAFAPTPFTSSNEVALTKEKAEELGVTKISDLADKAADLNLYGSPECRQRTDCLLGLKEVYGLKFKKFTPVALDLRHEVLKKGQADVSIVFTTDPQIKREGFVLLEDDKKMFPPNQSNFVVRDDIAKKAGPDLSKVIDSVQAGLNAEVMQELSARVDLDKKTPDVVAGEYLRESGLVK